MRVSLLIRTNTELADRDLLGLGFVLVGVACLFGFYFLKYLLYRKRLGTSSMRRVPEAGLGSPLRRTRLDTLRPLWGVSQVALNDPDVQLEAIGSHSTGAQKSSLLCCTWELRWHMWGAQVHPCKPLFTAQPGLCLKLTQGGHTQVRKPMFKDSQFISQFFYFISPSFKDSFVYSDPTRLTTAWNLWCL